MKGQLQKFGGFVRRNWLISAFVIVFAVTGTILLIASFALEPGKTPTEDINLQYGQNSLIKVPQTLVNSSTAQYKHAESHPFSIEYPAQWQLYKLDTTSTNAVNDLIYLRILSPDARIKGESHSTELELSSGAMVEVSVFSNDQFKSIDDYLNQLGANAVNPKKTTVNGKEAIVYQIAAEDEEKSNSPSKTITTFFDGNIQYTVSFSAATTASYNQYLNTYTQIVNKLSTH